ncbi:hypothetical protein AYM40_01290 [Paraburkholderia phytofirmans OLGA172]|uniref:Uncharacterized protein n=1 Tax=Paraburkholderia phytofirmans OLGA172 TaxID=1417228 RepID=A0A167VQC6_9BURK|nr:hypothetical protein AYM40_01290 [Paraburkholderia phytofirmans OLGA172]
MTRIFCQFGGAQTMRSGQISSALNDDAAPVALLLDLPVRTSAGKGIRNGKVRFCKAELIF